MVDDHFVPREQDRPVVVEKKRWNAASILEGWAHYRHAARLVSEIVKRLGRSVSPDFGDVELQPHTNPGM